MRILHIVPGVVSESSGPSYSVLRLSGSLQGLGLSSEVIALRLGRTAPITSRVREFPVSWRLNRLGWSNSMLRWLHEESALGTVSLLHSHSLWMMPNVYPAWVSRKSGVPLVVSPRGTLSDWAFEHGSRLKPVFWSCLQRKAVEQAAVIHVTSEMERLEVRSRGFRAPIAVIPNGVDIPRESDAATKSSRPYVAFLGRLHPKKGVDVLLQAWSRLEASFPAWDLCIAGPLDSSYAHELQRLAQGLGLTRARFLGELKGRSKVQFLAGAAFSVLPTHSENFGMAVAESLACGTAAIVTRGAPWQGLEQHGAGWWIEGGTESVASALHRGMLTPQKRLVEMGGAGRAWMQRDHSWERIGAMMHQVYAWIRGCACRPEWVVD